ncbi:unnamed protein product, partial [Mycena citricolor]
MIFHRLDLLLDVRCAFEVVYSTLSFIVFSLTMTKTADRIAVANIILPTKISTAEAHEINVKYESRAHTRESVSRPRRPRHGPVPRVQRSSDERPGDRREALGAREQEERRQRLVRVHLLRRGRPYGAEAAALAPRQLLGVRREDWGEGTHHGAEQHGEQ